MTIKQKVKTAIATGAILAATLLPGAAFAASGNTCTISGSGHNSLNICKIKITNTSVTVKSNTATVGNIVLAGASTGGNSADLNNGGSNSVKTGDATVSVTITNTLNQNN